ncbi:hypothetical protein [Amycolatopsis sp. A1MSW2902]|uniref:hypothetical protein n=1 Tax=Amycolatopsis sp. A1MSW2902 TaxID=687413 RepID=UPI00307FC7F0
MARIVPGLSARELSLASAFGLYVTAAPLGAVALIAAPTAVDAIRLPVYAGLGVVVGFLCSRRSRQRAAAPGRGNTRPYLVAHALAMPCALSFAKFHDLGWDDPRLGGVLFTGAGLSVLLRALARRRVIHRRAEISAGGMNTVPARPR